MSYYRLYFMDELSGHVTSFVEINAHNDAAALAEAEMHRGRLAMELWCGGKKIKRWPPNFISAADCAELGQGPAPVS